MKFFYIIFTMDVFRTVSLTVTALTTYILYLLRIFYVYKYSALAVTKLWNTDMLYNKDEHQINQWQKDESFQQAASTDWQFMLHLCTIWTTLTLKTVVVHLQNAVYLFN